MMEQLKDGNNNHGKGERQRVAHPECARVMQSFFLLKLRWDWWRHGSSCNASYTRKGRRRNWGLELRGEYGCFRVDWIPDFWTYINARAALFRSARHTHLVSHAASR